MLFSYLVLILLINHTINFAVAESSQSSESFLASKHRRLLSEIKHPKSSGNRTHNETKTTKAIPSPTKEYESVAGTEVAVLFIVVIVVLSVIGMVIYFIRKFDQLNRSLPTYRYSSLKTEINGYGPDDDKNESQALVNVSTEEEDDYDDEEEDLDLKPPTLMVQSQTVQSIKHVNGTIPVTQDMKVAFPKSAESSIDSDDELLQ